MGRSLRRHCCGSCPEFNRFQYTVGGDINGPRVLLEQRRRSASLGRLGAPRLLVNGRSEPVCEWHHDRSGESKSRLDCIFKLQLPDLGDARPRLRSDPIRAFDGDVDEPRWIGSDGVPGLPGDSYGS